MREKITECKKKARRTGVKPDLTGADFSKTVPFGYLARLNQALRTLRRAISF